MAFITQSGKVSFGGAASSAADASTSTALVNKGDAGDRSSELEALVFGVTQTSQSTLLLKKRKEMREVDEALDFMKEEFKQRMEACDERQRLFELKQSEMKEQVARFEKFVQENDGKRARAEQKTKLEAKLRLQQEEKLGELQERLREMQRERESLEHDLDALRPYQRYLEAAVDASEGEYEEIPDILNRYKTLRGANLDLTRLVGEGERGMDSVRADLTALRRETANAVLVRNSEIHTNQKQLERIRASTIKAENERELGERFTKDRHRESGQVVMSIKNLHARCLDTAHTQKRSLPAGAGAGALVPGGGAAGGSGVVSSGVVSSGVGLGVGMGVGSGVGSGVSGVHGKAVKSQAQMLSEYLSAIQFRITDLQTMTSFYKSGAYERETREQVKEAEES
jgi:hypothetical protein